MKNSILSIALDTLLDELIQIGQAIEDAETNQEAEAGARMDLDRPDRFEQE